MAVWESSSTLSSRSGSVDLLGDLLWDLRRLSRFDIFLVTSDAAGGVGDMFYQINILVILNELKPAAGPSVEEESYLFIIVSIVYTLT